MAEYNIKNVLNKYGLEISEEQEIQLEEYMLGILEYNKSINLTAIKEPEEFIHKHYLDSLSPLLDGSIGKDLMESRKIIDVGTGGGFPGVPLAVVLKDCDFTLLDSLNKRLRIIDELCRETGIENVKTLHARAEDAGRDDEFREKYDICVSRAVSHLAVLSEYTLPFVKKGGYMISYKGNDLEKEIEESRKAISTLGGEIEAISETVTDQTLVIIKKVKETPNKYPRKAGDPKKAPLGIK